MSDRFGMTGNYLVHSAKGTSWEKKDHKYIRKENGKYYYKENKSCNNDEIIKNLKMDAVKSLLADGL